MSTHTFPIYKFVQPDSLKPRLPFEQGPAVVMETLMKDFHMDITNNCLSSSVQSVDFTVNANNSEIMTSLSIFPWRPNTRLCKLHTQFQNNILYQHICVPCVYCARLIV